MNASTTTILPLGTGIELHLSSEQAKRAWAILSAEFGTETTTTAPSSADGDGMTLDRTHSMWDHQSGQSHKKFDAWTDADLDRAVVFLGDVRGKAKLFFDYLLDRPGRVIDTHDFAAAFPEEFPTAYSLAGTINGLRKARELSDRRYPFSYWQTEGVPTRYAIHPDTAQIFNAARKAAS